jgi:hypothetical protein
MNRSTNASTHPCPDSGLLGTMPATGAGSDTRTPAGPEPSPARLYDTLETRSITDNQKWWSL